MMWYTLSTLGRPCSAPRQAKSLGVNMIFMLRQTFAMVSCSSVRPSVTLVDCDDTRWNSSKIISKFTRLRAVSLQQHGSY